MSELLVTTDHRGRRLAQRTLCTCTQIYILGPRLVHTVNLVQLP